MSCDASAPNSIRLRVVYRLLDNDLVENSLFLLDRLHAQDPDNECWIHLRSLCCLRLARYAAAYEYSRAEAAHGRHSGCVYVFAQACLHLNLPRDGIAALERGMHQKMPETAAERFIPDTAALNCILGRLHRANEDVRNAIDAYARALEADPFMWDAFTELCDLGANLNLSNIFQLRATKLPGAPATSWASVNSPPLIYEEDEEMENYTPTASRPVIPRPRAQTPAKRKQDVAQDVTPLRQPALQSTNSILTGTLTPRRGSSQSSLHPSLSHRGTLGNSRQRSRVILEPKSRKTLADTQLAVSPPRAPASRHDSKTRRGKLAASSPMQPHSDPTVADEELRPLCDLFIKLGTAYYHLTRFQPRACLDILAGLAVEQQATPWVLTKTARAHYEMMDYASARSAFETLRASCTSWVEDLEVHAAALWHLGDDVRLAHEAHDLTEHHRLSPQAWCAAGCAMSREGRRQDAIASFRRAAQLRPTLARAYSLLGHEQFDCEEYYEANRAFRRALQVDARHYVAWVGLGRVQERLGAPKRALRYYLGAQKISPDNGVVLTNIARVYDMLGLPELGLRFIRRSQLHASIRLAVFTKVQTAKLLLRIKEPEEAAKELSSALEMAPDNAEIHLLLGQTVMEAGRLGLKEVIQRFTVALSLRPHSRVIKEAIAGLGSSPRKTRRITRWNT